jgi:hypothetical protein
MEFLLKKDIIKLMDDLNNISSAIDIINIHDQRVCYIDIHPISGLKYTIAGFFFGYAITVCKDKDIFGHKETVYRCRFNILTLLKIRRVVKKYEKLEKLKRLKEIRGA